MKNEKGGSLLIVLLTVSIIFILGISITSMSIATRAQFNKTEDINVATDIAEMGISHYQKSIENNVKTANTHAVATTEQFYNSYLNLINAGVKNIILPTDIQLDNVYRNAFCTRFENISTEITKVKRDYPLKLDNPNIHYQIEPKVQYQIYSTNIIGNCRSDNEIKLIFDSRGRLDDSDKSISGLIIISKLNTNFSPETTAVPTKNQFEKIHSEEVKLPGKITNIVFNSSTYFVSSVKSTGKPSNFKVNGNTFFNDDVQWSGPVTILIEGDAIFKFTPKINSESPHQSICIKGKTYIINARNQLEEITIEKNKCANPNKNFTKFGWGSGLDIKSIKYK